jgi:uncharacterized membrane protein
MRSRPRPTVRPRAQPVETEGVAQPAVRVVVGIFAVIAALQIFDLITHQDVLSAVITIVICGAYIGWWIWSNRYR